MSALTALLAAMVEIDTTNPSLQPGAPGEAALAHFLARRLGDAGLEVELQPIVLNSNIPAGIVAGSFHSATVTCPGL